MNGSTASNKGQCSEPNNDDVVVDKVPVPYVLFCITFLSFSMYVHCTVLRM